MRLWAWVYRIDPSEYDVRTPACYGCIRFYKTALKERPRIFRFLNDRINPLFEALMKRIATTEEIQQAKSKTIPIGVRLSKKHKRIFQSPTLFVFSTNNWDGGIQNRLFLSIFPHFLISKKQNFDFLDSFSYFVLPLKMTLSINTVSALHATPVYILFKE
jgi:hypothetical protein